MAEGDEWASFKTVTDLGSGGMGDVHLALDRGAEGFTKLVVVKRIRRSLAANKNFVGMFLDEARLAARLNHPHVVQTYRFGRDGEQYYLAMEYLDGQTLQAILERAAESKDADPLPLRLLLQMLSDVLSGLHYAHELCDYDGRHLELVHRDMSPANVIVTYDGQVKVVDFGVAKTLASSVETTTGDIKGRILYMPPEQEGAERVDRRADVFAVGVMLWEVITKRRLWQGLSVAEVVRRLRQGEIPSPRKFAPEIRESLERTCMKALAPRREERFATAAEFRSALDLAIAEMGPRPTFEEIGAAVSGLFAEDRRKRRAIISGALARIGGAPDTGPFSEAMPVSKSEVTQSESRPRIPTGDSSVRSAVAASRRPSLPPTAMGSMPTVLGAMAIAAVAVAIGIWIERPSSPTLSAAGPAAAEPTARPQIPVALVIRTSTPGAQVWIDNFPAQGAPIERTFLIGTLHSIRVEAPGYVPRTEALALSQRTELTIDLERRP